MSRLAHSAVKCLSYWNIWMLSIWASLNAALNSWPNNQFEYLDFRSWEITIWHNVSYLRMRKESTWAYSCLPSIAEGLLEQFDFIIVVASIDPLSCLKPCENIKNKIREKGFIRAKVRDSHETEINAVLFCNINSMEYIS